MLCVLWGLLAASGWGLSYLVSERWRVALGWGHAGAGFLAFAVGVLHARPIRWPSFLARERRRSDPA